MEESRLPRAKEAAAPASIARKSSERTASIASTAAMRLKCSWLPRRRPRWSEARALGKLWHPPPITTCPRQRRQPLPWCKISTQIRLRCFHRASRLWLIASKAENHSSASWRRLSLSRVAWEELLYSRMLAIARCRTRWGFWSEKPITSLSKRAATQWSNNSCPLTLQQHPSSSRSSWSVRRLARACTKILREWPLKLPNIFILLMTNWKIIVTITRVMWPITIRCTCSTWDTSNIIKSSSRSGRSRRVRSTRISSTSSRWSSQASRSERPITSPRMKWWSLSGHRVASTSHSSSRHAVATIRSPWCITTCSNRPPMDNQTDIMTALSRWEGMPLKCTKMNNLTR